MDALEAEMVQTSPTRLEVAKAELLQTIANTDRGRQVSPQQREQIEAQVQTLESLNPTPAPTAAAADLTGNWRTLYTTSQDLLKLSRTLPGIVTGEIYQYIDAAEARVINVAELQGWDWLSDWIPGGIVSVVASFAVVSERRVEVTFNRFVIGVQPLMNYQIDSFLTLLHRKPDQIPALKIDLPAREQRGWLDITYLDPDLRIGRGNEGSLFVLDKVSEG